MILYIIILLIVLKLNMFNGWILGLWIAGIVLKTLCDIFEFIKHIIDIYD